jgi:hypothetical protein
MTTLSFKICIIFCVSFCSCKNTNNGDTKQNVSQNNNTLKPKQQIDILSLRLKAKEAKVYCKTKNLDKDFYILVDLKRHSGLKRFFIWDFKKDTILNGFLVSHGCSENPWGRDQSKELAEVSNADGSHASSIGRYIITERGYSNWGINVKYILHGQDKTNSNAMKRLIVLHSWEKVSDEEIFPSGTPEGWGCPAISNASMQIVDNKLKSTNKKVLLWVVQ